MSMFDPNFFVPSHVVLDGTELFEWRVEDGRLYRVHRSWGEQKVMDQNREGRAHGVRRLSFGRLALRMTEAQYYWLLNRYPDLKSEDGAVKTKAWRMVAQNPDYLNLVVDRW